MSGFPDVQCASGFEGFVLLLVVLRRVLSLLVGVCLLKFSALNLQSLVLRTS